MNMNNKNKTEKKTTSLIKSVERFLATVAPKNEMEQDLVYALQETMEAAEYAHRSKEAYAKFLREREDAAFTIESCHARLDQLSDLAQVAQTPQPPGESE